MQQDLDRQAFDEYYNFLHYISSIVSDFCFLPFTEKEAAFKSALSLAPTTREALAAKDHNFTQFLITLVHELNSSISICFTDQDTPTESLLSKLIDYRDFKLELPQPGSSNTKPKICLTYKKLSTVIECLSLMLELAKNDANIYDIIRSSTNLAVPVIRLLKAVADLESAYNLEILHHHILIPKQILWNSLEQLLAEGSLFHVFGCISKDSFKEFFELMELNNREYAESARDILKKLSKVGQNNALFSKLSGYLNEKKCLLSLWRSLKFYQERQTFAQKEAFLKYIISNFSIGNHLLAPFISHDILNEVLLFLDLDLLSVLLSCTGESQDNVNYLQTLIDSVTTLSQFPLYIYGSGDEDNMVQSNPLPKGSPSKHIINPDDPTLKNTTFLKVLFDVIIKTSQDKKTWSWHYFLKEMNISLLQNMIQSSHNYRLLEVTMKPFKFLVKTIHTCEYGCMIHSLDIMDYILTQVPQRNIEDDIFLLSVHLEKLDDIISYLTLIEHILALCESNKKVLSAFSKDIHFLENIVTKLLSYIKQEPENKISLDFARTLCSLILLLIEQNKGCLDTIAKLSLIQTMLTSFQNHDENGDLQANFIFFVNNILLLDLQCKEKFSNVGQACSTLKSFQKNHGELTKNIFETFRHLRLHLDKNCMRKLVKEFELFDLVLELLELNFEGIGTKDSEFYYIWDLLADFLSTSGDVASYFSCKLQGFIKIVNFAKNHLAKSQQEKIIQQLIFFSLYSPNSNNQGGYAKIHQNLSFEELNQLSAGNSTIKYPRLFREIYSTLILPNKRDEYITFLNNILNVQPLNYKILNTCEFVEYLHNSLISSAEDIIFDLAIKFFENAPSPLILRVLTKYFNLETRNKKDNSPDIQQFQSPKESTILQTLQKKLSSHHSETQETLLLQNDASFDYQLLWVPKIHVNFKHADHPQQNVKVPNHALTFFAKLKLDFSSIELSSFTLFTLMSKSGNQIFRAYLSKQAFILQFKEQEITLDPQFLTKIASSSEEFTIALVLVAPNLLTSAQQAKQDTFISFYLNGNLVGDFSVKINPAQNLFADGHYQLLIGSYEDNNHKSALELLTFWMLKRPMSIHEPLNLHALSLASSTPMSLTSNIIKFELSKLGKDFHTEKLPFDFNLDKAIAFYSEASFSENIHAEIAWSSVLEDAVLLFSVDTPMQRFENNQEIQNSIFKEPPHLAAQSLQENLTNFHDKELLSFIPNLASTDEIGSQAFLIGFRCENDITDYNSLAFESNQKSLVRILEESDFLQVLVVKFLNSIRENNSQLIKEILLILISLYKKSEKARQYLIENNFLSFACNAFETAQSSQEQEELLQIYQNLFIDQPKKDEKSHSILYSINAFKKIFESLDILASANNLVQTFGLNLLENELLKEDNTFFRWNVKLLREIQFGQMLINGLLIGRYVNISDNIYKIICQLLWYRNDQCADLDCVNYIGEALGFLFFASGNITNPLSPAAKNKKFEDFGKPENEEENKENQDMSYFNRKYLTLARQNFSYAQAFYQKLLNTIVDLLVETTMRPLNIELLSLLLNIVFCYGDSDSHYKIITILFSYIPRFWQTSPDYHEEDDTDSEEEIAPSPGLILPNPAKSIWKALSKTSVLSGIIGNKPANPKSEEGQIKKTKNREKFLKGLYNYLKALLLIHGYNIDRKDANKLISYLNMLGIHAETLFDATYQEDTFLHCLLYQLLVYLISDCEIKIKDKALAVLCCILCQSKDTIKKALTFEKINLFDLGFQNLLKNREKTSVISFSNYAQFISEKTPVIQNLLDSKLGLEWSRFAEQIKLTFEAGLPRQSQSQSVILKDSPYHYHTILLPHLYLPSSAIKSKTKTLPLLSFFNNSQQAASSKGERNSLNNLENTMAEISVSQKAVKERFDRAYVSLQYQNKCKRLASLARENEINGLIKRSKKKMFLSSLQNSSNVADITLANYSWHLDTKNYPKGQRLKLKLKELHVDKSQYERSPLKKPVRKSIDPEDILILPSDNQDLEPKPARKRFLSASAAQQRSSLKIEGEINSASDEKSLDLLMSIQKVQGQQANSVHSLDEDEVFKAVEEVQSQTGTFRYNNVNRELDINEVIVSKYNCLYIDLQEKAECVFIVGKCSLYICTNYQLNKHGDIREVDPLDEKTITRLKWVLPTKREKLRKNESLGDLESVHSDDDKYRSKSRSSFSELDQEYSESKPKIIQIPLHHLVEVHARRYLMYPNALEIYLDSGKSYLLAFNVSVRNHSFLDIINAHAHYFNPNIDKLEIAIPKDSLFFASLLPELLSSKKKAPVRLIGSPRFYIHSAAGLVKQAQSLWSEGELSNFDYLMLLNTLSGRTLNDLAQYPVFPWVIQQYQGEHFRYTRKENYRPLAAPIGSMTPERIEIVKKRFVEAKDSIMMSPYHYGSHYSSPGIMMYYFIRMFPFSQFSAHLQGGRFDFPNRLFSNIKSTFNLAQTTDFKELTPEFFTLPEFLVNLNRFYFGSTQEGTLIHHVVTSQWAKNNPRLFVQTMRRALESESTSRGINEWIDLIFGYKQRDKKAEEALNLYHAITYEGAINFEGGNEFELECLLTQINEFGQCPKRLFDSSHPQRKRMPHNHSLFASKEHLRNCTFVSLRDPIDPVTNKNVKFDRIKLKSDIVDPTSRVGFGGFQAIPTIDDPETETILNLKKSLMFAHRGYLLRGGRDNQFINWNSPFKSLFLYTFEKDRNVIRAFNSREFEDITSASISKDGELLILGNKYGRLSTFSFREEVLHTIIPAQTKERRKSSSKRKNESELKPSVVLDEIVIRKIRPDIQSEWAVEGIEVKDEKIRHSILGFAVNKKKYHHEDFSTKGSRRRNSKEINAKEDEVNSFRKYCRIHRAVEDETREKTTKLILENCVPEAHKTAIAAIQVSKSWNLMITADNQGICKVWDLKKCKLAKEIYTYHFKDQDIFNECLDFSVNKNAEQEDNYFTQHLKLTTEREKIKSIIISESNGDFCVVSSHYISVYTINGVLISTLSTRQNQLPPIKSALLTKSQYSYEENFLILGHKKGLLTFWIFKENSTLKNLKEIKHINQQDDVLAGKFGHIYDLSAFINQSLPLNELTKISECEVPSVVQDHHTDLSVTSLSLSTDQTKLLVALNTGEIFCFKKQIDLNADKNKSCGWCSSPIGIVDARIICAVCQKMYCINCATLEESVNSAHLWKKVRLCPQCSVQSNSKSSETLYDFY